MNNAKYFFLVIIALYATTAVSAAGKDTVVIDQILGVVGDDVILKSDVEEQYIQYLNSGMDVSENSRCMIFEDLLYQSLLLHQAKEDSVVVSDAQVEAELDRRLRYFINQFGSEKKLEQFYKKSIAQIKAEMFEPVKNQILVQQMQSKITQDVKVTPAEVREYFQTIHEDSLPFINSEVEIAQIVRTPSYTEEAKNEVKEKLEKFKERITGGEDFGTIAYLYSEDPGSAAKNGELGFMSRNDLVPEFSAVAFSLEPGEVSGIVETKFGYHLIQMIEKRGQKVNVRHILLTPRISSEALAIERNYLDSISGIIQNTDTVSFEKAAREHSQDRESKTNGGMMVNPVTGTTKFEMDQLGQADKDLFFVIDNMKVGDISKPVSMQTQDGKKALRLVKLVSRTEPHKANLKDDYQRIQEATKLRKQNEVITGWINNKLKNTYVNIKPEFRNCEFQNAWLTAAQ